MRVCLASGGFLSFLVLIQQAQGVPKYRSVGCYRDTQEGRQRPLPRLLADLRPYIEWPDISKTIDKCAALAQTEGYRFFGVQFFGECWSGTNSIDDVTRDGKSNACFQGVGEAFANFVYELPVKGSLSIQGTLYSRDTSMKLTPLFKEYLYSTELSLLNSR
ncbi:predicted protein [Nematostella vectensis]|uniref:WSC domain-containing protein n=1 Tax=Nematostella vectensis TaxID=45351 RepID=A7S5B3_NEMVE|nr:predicted protein [Nematostella vectensis]|eukprot:XP_001633123.1 predicted protein [Nematostella vectensis]